MICISISQASRLFTLVDMFNAVPRCDLLEVRLDRFDRTPDVHELLAAKRKPVIMTCRRAEDGGDWQGREPERLTLLRQCLDEQADYVEIELDVADQLPPQPPSKRILSYTNMLEVPEDLSEIYAQLLSKHPDVIKLTVPVRTPEEAWPLVQILAKPAAPTVVMGLGPPGIMLSILARKVGAPWVYAALERGMEAYYGQATIDDLETVYDYRAIQRGTRLVGVTGFGEVQHVQVALLNAALAAAGQSMRCLPLGIGDLRAFRKVLEATKLAGVVIDEEHQSAVREIVSELEPSAQLTGVIDLIVHQGDKWQGCNVHGWAALTALESSWRAQGHAEKPFQDRAIILVGIHRLTHALAAALRKVHALPILCSSDLDAGPDMAEQWECKFIDPEAIAATPHDALLLCEQSQLTGNALRPGTMVLDLTAALRKSSFLWNAERHGCHIVPPGQILVEQVRHQVQRLVGHDVDRAPLLDLVQKLVEE